MNDDCPDEHLILDWLEGALAPAESSALDDHLDRCPLCLRLISELGRAMAP